MSDGLLLLHAFPLDASMWDPQVAALAEGIRVVAPNAPGFGGTPISEPVTTMEAVADLAAAAVDRAGLGRVVVCGLSVGGYVALSMWRRHRDRVAGFLFANTRAVADDEESRRRRISLAERLRTEGQGFLVENPPALLSAGAPGDLRERVRETIARQPAEAIAAISLGMAERADSTGDLAGIDVPTLVVTSSADALIPAEATSRMARAIPGARLEVIQGAGHLSNLEAPEAFNRLLWEHLAASGVRPV